MNVHDESLICCKCGVDIGEQASEIGSIPYKENKDRSVECLHHSHKEEAKIIIEFLNSEEVSEAAFLAYKNYLISGMPYVVSDDVNYTEKPSKWSLFKMRIKRMLERYMDWLHKGKVGE